MGQATIRIGLYDPESGVRLPLGGENDGQRAYKAGTLELLPASDNVFIQFKDGWHNAEVAAENAQVEWQWTKKVATLALRNPRRDATFFLHFDGRPDLVPGQTLTIRIGDQVLDTSTLTTNEELIRRVPIAATQFGDTENVDLTIEVNQAFVPAQTPAAKSSDPARVGCARVPRLHRAEVGATSVGRARRAGLPATSTLPGWARSLNAALLALP